MDISEITIEEYYGELKLLFASAGWTILLAELRDNAHNINDLQACTETSDMWFRKGQLAVIANLLSFESQLLRAEEEAEQEKDTSEGA